MLNLKLYINKKFNKFELMIGLILLNKLNKFIDLVIWNILLLLKIYNNIQIRQN